MRPQTRTSMTPRMRSVFQALTAAVTGVVTFGSVAATGWLAGHQAKDYEDQGTADAGTAGTTTAPTPAPRVVAKSRPHRTEIRTVYVPAGGVAPGSGGTVHSSSGGSSGGGSGGSSGGGGSSSGGGAAPAPAPAPAPPPPPAPAPSSGS